MVLKKKLLTLYYLTLSQAKVDSLAEGRFRDSVAKHAFEALKEFELARIKIYEAFCVKDDKGEPKLVDNNYQFSREEAPKAAAEVKILEDEEVDVPITNAGKVKALIEATKYEPKVGETEVIDELLAQIK